MINKNQADRQIDMLSYTNVEMTFFTLEASVSFPPCSTIVAIKKGALAAS